MPAHHSTKIICDFDGTTTTVDTTDAILGRFAQPEWEEVERAWVDGEITSMECMSRQIPMIKAPHEELDAFIDGFALTPGFKEFSEFCRERGLPLFIVSDGIDYVINRVLANHGLSEIPVFANHLVFTQDGYELVFPASKEGCAFGMCKCAVADVKNGRTVLIGDGHSDSCIARHASVVYAKSGKSLEKFCVKNGIDYVPFDDFHAIIRRNLTAEFNL